LPEIRSKPSLTKTEYAGLRDAPAEMKDRENRQAVKEVQERLLMSNQSKKTLMASQNSEEPRHTISMPQDPEKKEIVENYMSKMESLQVVRLVSR